jgi:hypothetical protein
MPKPIHESRDNSATLRQLKLLVVLLVLSNVGLGTLSFYLLRKVDERYSDLIDQALPLVVNLESLTIQAVDAMRTTNPKLFQAGDEGRETALRRARTSLETARTLRETILRRDWLQIRKQRAEFQRSGEEFTREAAEVVRLLASGDLTAAEAWREQHLRPAFDHYLENARKATSSLETEAQRINDEFTASTSSTSKAMLGLGGWPLLLLVALLAITAVFVLVLMLLFRGREMSDTP